MARPVIDEKQTLDFSAMNVDQMMGEALELAGVLDLCNSQRQAIFAEIAARKADVKARAAVSGMTALEVDALAAVVSPAGQVAPAGKV